MASVGIFGAGWVGLVTGVCLAELGHEVVVRDIVSEKVAALSRGEVPFHERDLSELLEGNRAQLTFTESPADLAGCAFLFVCVDTPPTPSGDADLSRVWRVIDELPALEGPATLVMKSTVPVGTGEKVRLGLDERGLGSLAYVSNPEFLAEGTAVRDFMHPDRIVVGGDDESALDGVAGLYAALSATVVRCDVKSAEMIKLAANAFLMTRISFINEIANVCDATGADVVKVAEGVGLDHRLGPHFLRAGIGYGGSCLAGSETVLVRLGGATRLVTLEALYRELEQLGPSRIEVLSWSEESGAAFLPVAAVTRRHVDDEIVLVRTTMGRRVACTPDHPFVTADGTKLASELTDGDWLPLATAPPLERRSELERGAAPAALPAAGLAEAGGDVRARGALAGVAVARAGAAPARETLRRETLRPETLRPETLRPETLPDLSLEHGSEIRRGGTLHPPGVARLGLELADASVGSATDAPTSVPLDVGLWRLVGLSLSGGHSSSGGDGSSDGRRTRLRWSFRPTDEERLVEEVTGYRRALGVTASVRRRLASTCVTVSSRPLAAWWTTVLGLGRDASGQRLPDQIWSSPDAYKGALLSGLWQRGGSWSTIADGPSVALEFGTASRPLADGLLRLLADLGIVAQLKVGRSAASTVEAYRIAVSGADQVERLLDLVDPEDRERIEESVARQPVPVAPTGYRRRGSTAWLRVVETVRSPFSGEVYSLEVPGTHTFVTTGGLVVHNCFPKDSLALKQLASNSGYHFQLLAAVIEVNDLQKRRVIGKLRSHLGSLRDRKIALLGLAFKPGTDDMREAPSIVLAGRLIAEGAEVRGWDPVADGRALGIVQVDSVAEAVAGADAAVIVTEWPELAGLASAEVREAMATPLIIDGRNLLDPAQARAAGFRYEGIGRPASDRVEAGV